MPNLTAGQLQMLRLLGQCPGGTAAPAELGRAMRPPRTAAAVRYDAALLASRGLVTLAGARRTLSITSAGRSAAAGPPG